jgi:hypothetical protein
MTTNYRDPRYQKAMLRAQANPVGTQGATDAVASQHALNEASIHNQFINMETQKRDFKSSMGLAKGRLSLAKKQLAHDKKNFKQKLKDGRQDMNRTMLLGLGTAGWSFMEGRRRATLRRADIERDRKRHEEIMKHIGSKV